MSKGDSLDRLEGLGVVRCHLAHAARLGVELAEVYGHVHHAVLVAHVALMGRCLARRENVAGKVCLHHGHREAPVDALAVGGDALEVPAVVAGAYDLVRKLRHGGARREERECDRCLQMLLHELFLFSFLWNHARRSLCPASSKNIPHALSQGKPRLALLPRDGCGTA